MSGTYRPPWPQRVWPLLAAAICFHGAIAFWAHAGVSGQLAGYLDAVAAAALVFLCLWVALRSNVAYAWDPMGLNRLGFGGWRLEWADLVDVTTQFDQGSGVTFRLTDRNGPTRRIWLGAGCGDADGLLPELLRRAEPFEQAWVTLARSGQVTWTSQPLRLGAVLAALGCVPVGVLAAWFYALIDPELNAIEVLLLFLPLASLAMAVGIPLADRRLLVADGSGLRTPEGRLEWGRLEAIATHREEVLFGGDGVVLGVPKRSRRLRELLRLTALLAPQAKIRHAWRRDPAGMVVDTALMSAPWRQPAQPHASDAGRRQGVDVALALAAVLLAVGLGSATHGLVLRAPDRWPRTPALAELRCGDTVDYTYLAAGREQHGEVDSRRGNTSSLASGFTVAYNPQRPDRSVPAPWRDAPRRGAPWLLLAGVLELLLGGVVAWRLRASVGWAVQRIRAANEALVRAKAGPGTSRAKADRPLYLVYGLLLGSAVLVAPTLGRHDAGRMRRLGRPAVGTVVRPCGRHVHYTYSVDGTEHEGHTEDGVAPPVGSQLDVFAWQRGPFLSEEAWQRPAPPAPPAPPWDPRSVLGGIVFCLSFVALHRWQQSIRAVTVQVVAEAPGG